jgi:hypothetical protein
MILKKKSRLVCLLVLASVEVVFHRHQLVGENMTRSTDYCSQELSNFQNDHDLVHLSSVTSNLGAQNVKKDVPGDADQPTQLLQSWIKLFVVIDSNNDPAYDKSNPTYRFTMHVPPLLASKANDPEALKQYSERVRSNRERAEKSRFQIRIRAIDNKATWIFAGFVITNFSDDSRSVLFKDLITHSNISENRKKEILDLQRRKSLH